MPLTQNTVWIRERFSHMGQHSGYDMLCGALEKHVPESTSIWATSEQTPTRLESLFVHRYYKNLTKPVFYGEHHLIAELRAILHRPFSKKLIHILFAENNLALLSNSLGKLQNKVVATFHQPLHWWIARKQNIKHLTKHLDAAIVLSSAEKNAFEKHLPGKVHFIPHGVDSHFFKPREENRSNNEIQCLFVGQWLRDFPTLENVIKQVTSNKQGIKFNLVVPKDRIDRHVHKETILRLIKHPNVVWHHGISDDDLVRLYQDSDMLVLPLEQATANNAIVEALSSGLPVISTDISSVHDYVTTKCSLLSEPNDAEEMANNITSLINNDALRMELAQEARLHALRELSWERIAEKTLGVYEKLA
jgi:glycosyltransferase involved in cell wall biosynthesis